MSQEQVSRWRAVFEEVFPPWWVPWALAQCDLESGGNPTVLTNGASACTPQGGRGLFQITSLYYYKKYFESCVEFDLSLQDPVFNCVVYWAIMQPLLAENPNVLDALEYYNQGPGWNKTDYSYAKAILSRLPCYL